MKTKIHNIQKQRYGKDKERVTGGGASGLGKEARTSSHIQVRKSSVELGNIPARDLRELNFKCVSLGAVAVDISSSPPFVFPSP